MHGDRSHAVDQKWVGHRRSRRRDRNQQIEVRDRRPHQAVFARMDVGQVARTILRLDFQRDPIANDRLADRLAETAARLALDQPLGRIHIIEPADALENDPFDQKIRPFCQLNV